MNLRGAFTALITPFRDGGVDIEALRAHVDRQIDAGIHGLVPCGTTGEAATMSAAEQLKVIETVADAADGRVPVVAGTGSNDTRTTIEHTRKVAEIDGVDAALVVVPYYNKPDQAGLIAHFTAVADQGGMPVVLYNVPGRTGQTLTAETVAALAANDQIVGLKEASGDLGFDSEILEAVDDDFALLSGDDFTTWPLLACGGRGCVSVVSNIDPASMSHLCEAAARGHVELARRLHAKIQPLARQLFAAPNPVPAKTMAAHLGWCTARVRSPLCPASAGLRDSLEAFIDDYPLG